MKWEEWKSQVLPELNHIDIYPILGPSYADADFIEVNLGIKNMDLIDPTSEALQNYLTSQLLKTNSRLAIGGYAEDRNLYGVSALFQDIAEPRTIHLGIDIWAPNHTPLFNPLDGIVHSSAYNNNELDYGYTVIIAYQVLHYSFFILYGHLGSRHYPSWIPGSKIRKGQLFAEIGPVEENGGWVPHLHLQVILDIGNYSGDYPGVCKRSHAKRYMQNSPDPSPLIKKAPKNF